MSTPTHTPPSEPPASTRLIDPVDAIVLDMVNGLQTLAMIANGFKVAPPAITSLDAQLPSAAPKAKQLHTQAD